MPEEINKYIDNKIANSLTFETSEKFTDRLMREIELSKEFERQDKKENLSVRYIIAGISTLILSFVFAFGYYISKQLENEDSMIGSNYGTVSSYIRDFFSNSLSIFGLTISKEVFVYGFILMGLLVAGSLVDKYIFRRSY
jgi:hypothetical protein